MIIKSLGRKSGVGKLLSYITRDKAVVKDKKGNPVILKFNIKGKSIEEFEKAFKENEANRKYKRKGTNEAFHIIMSFSPEDTINLTTKTMEDLAYQYILLHNEASMAVGSFHNDKEHMHVHLVMGGTECVTGKSIRISKERFNEIKEQMQEYQKVHYPELVSIVNHSKKSERQIKDNEYQLKARTKQPSRKDDIKAILETAFQQSLNQKEFHNTIQELGLKTYQRGNKIGIDDNRHYRLETLGYGEEKMKALNLKSGRIQEIESLRCKSEMEIDQSQMNEQEADVQEDDKTKTDLPKGNPLESPNFEHLR